MMRLPTTLSLLLLSSALLLGACTCQPIGAPAELEGSGTEGTDEGSAEEPDDEPTEAEIVEAALVDEVAFTELCLQWGRDLLPEQQVNSPAPMELMIGQTRLLLGNTRRLCRNNPEGCHADFDLMIAHAADQERTERPAVVAANIRAVLTNRAAVEAARSQNGAELVTRPFVGDIELVYVVDEPTTIRWATTELLAEAGISVDDVHEIAMENTRRDLGEFEVELFDEDLQIYGLDIGDSYENSRVILHDLWTDFAATLPSPLVIVVPTRGVVLASHANNRQGVMLMMSGALRAHAEMPHPVSMTPLLWTADGWEVFDPPATQPPTTDAATEQAPAPGTEPNSPEGQPEGSVESELK